MRLLALTSLSLVALISLFGCKHSSVVPAGVTDAEYQVLSAYTAGKFKGDVDGFRRILIFSDTLAISDDPKDPEGIANLKSALPAIETVYGQVFRAFLKVNRRPSSFRRSFTLPVPYQIIGPSEYDSIFRTAGGIDRYYKEYPNSTGLLRLSRVGFSPDGNQAAFYITIHCGGLCGGGYFVIMEKQAASDWKIVQDVQVWVS